VVPGPPDTGRHEDERGTKVADLLGCDLSWWYPIHRPQGRHERRSLTQTLLWDPLALDIEKQKQDAHADAVMAEFMELSTRETATLPYQRFEQIKRIES
jgi:hypothetical protein